MVCNVFVLICLLKEREDGTIVFFFKKRDKFVKQAQLSLEMIQLQEIEKLTLLITVKT